MTNQLHQLQVFDFKLSDAETRPIRTFGTPDEPWFAAADVCRVLGIANSRQAVASLYDWQKKTIRVSDGMTVSIREGMTVGVSDPMTLTYRESAKADSNESFQRIEDSQLEKGTIGSLEDQTYTTKGHHINSGPQRGGAQFLVLVNEPGFYRLVTKSRKPQAEAFSYWLFAQVLPSIRRTGSYGVNARTQPAKSNDVFARVIADALACNGPVEGTPTEVYARLTPLCTLETTRVGLLWPTSVKGLTQKLNQANTFLHHLGVVVARKRGNSRWVRLEGGMTLADTDAAMPIITPIEMPPDKPPIVELPSYEELVGMVIKLQNR